MFLIKAKRHSTLSLSNLLLHNMPLPTTHNTIAETAHLPIQPPKLFTHIQTTTTKTHSYREEIDAKLFPMSSKQETEYLTNQSILHTSHAQNFVLSKFQSSTKHDSPIQTSPAQAKRSNKLSLSTLYTPRDPSRSEPPVIHTLAWQQTSAPPATKRRLRTACFETHHPGNLEHSKPRLLEMAFLHHNCLLDTDQHISCKAPTKSRESDQAKPDKVDTYKCTNQSKLQCSQLLLPRLCGF